MNHGGNRDELSGTGDEDVRSEENGIPGRVPARHLQKTEPEDSLEDEQCYQLSNPV